MTAHGLPAHGTFDVVVRGVKVGTLTTNGHGAGKAKFRSGSAGAAGTRGHEQLLGFDPRGAEVIVRDEENGDDDLVGDMPDDGDSAAGAFACCFSNTGDDEVECEEMTPSECTSAGGTPNQATSCLPNPCPTTPSPGTVCCIPGSAQGAFGEEVDDQGDEQDNEVECEEDTSAGDCTAAGGMVVTATSCDANPCAPTPPPSLVACCVPDGEEKECEQLTPETCAMKGTPAGASCDTDPCAGQSGGGSQDGGGGGD